MRKLVSALALAIGISTPLAAQDYPTGPVTLVVPYSPGGNTDVLARYLAPMLQAKWGKPVVVDNRPGGGSMVGTALVSQAAPDGLTLLFTTSAYVTGPSIQASLPFDPRTDLLPIANAGYVSYVLLTHRDAGYESLDDFIKKSKEEPKFAATAGVGTTTHFAIEKFIADTGADVDVVHFQGGGPAVVAVLGKEANIYGASVSSSGEYIKSGELVPLAVIGTDRLATLPDVPSTAELGYPEVTTTQWVGVFAPKGTDPAIIAKVNSDLNEALKDPGLIEVVTPLDWTLTQSSPEKFATEIDAELTMWKKLAEERGITGQ